MAGPIRSSTPAGPSNSKRKQRLHRACDYCRTHRIKCIPIEGNDRCKRCHDHDLRCDKTADPPKDDRPRRRLLFKGDRSITQSQGLEASYLGSSSFPMMAWAHAPQDISVFNRFRSVDDRYDLYRGSIGAVENDGLLVGQRLTDAALEKPILISVTSARTKLVQQVGAEMILTSLYETCRDHVIPLFPVISVSESLLTDKATPEHVSRYNSVDVTPHTPLPQIIRIIHCALAAQSRSVPDHIRNSIKNTLHNLLMGQEWRRIVAANMLASVQALILLSMCDDLNAPDTADASAAVWRNVGTAIRMAFYIALHRNVSSSHISYFQLNRRLRVWGACICMDRWLAIREGRGYSIDLADCDAPLPRCFADGVRDGQVPGSNMTIFPCFRFLNELTQLSILIGRAYRLICAPLAIHKADDLSFVLLQNSIDTWIAQLPASWRYSSNIELRQAPDLMNVFIVALEFTLQRAFLWPIQPIPIHISYRPSAERWRELCRRAEQAVCWLNTTEGMFYLDVWSNVVYPALCCVIIHLKALEQSEEACHRWMLELADNVIQSWAKQAPENGTRARAASISTLLRTAGLEKNMAAVAVQDLIDTLHQAAGVSAQSFSGSETDPDGSQAFGLDISWFEQV